MSMEKVKNSGKKKKISYSQAILHLVFIAISACYILPFLMVVTISLSNAKNVMLEGFKIFPTEIDLTAYKVIFDNPDRILQAYKVTFAFTFMTVLLSLVVMALLAYPMSKSYFKHRSKLIFFVFFTMLFDAGMIPSYITNAKYLGLGNNFWVYVLPVLVNAWNVMIIKTFYNGLPNELFESAKIDGASEWRTFRSIVVPMSKPCYATIGFLTLVNKWNDWNTTLVYIRNGKLYSLQYMLQTMLRNVQELEKMMSEAPTMAAELEENISSEPMRFAMAIVAAGPVLLVFPWFQKYFVKGMTVGAVKG